MLRLVVSAIVALMSASGAARADPALGLWRTGPEGERHAIVRILPCGERICGQIAGAVDDRGDVPGWISRRTIFNMRPKGGGRYSGWVWRPANDRIFSGRLTLQNDQLTFQGCVIEGLVCFGDPWRRMD